LIADSWHPPLARVQHWASSPIGLPVRGDKVKKQSNPGAWVSGKHTLVLRHYSVICSSLFYRGAATELLEQNLLLNTVQLDIHIRKFASIMPFSSPAQNVLL